MRRITLTAYGQPATFDWQTLDTPEPAPGTVRVRVQAAGLNPIDAKIARGEMAAMMPTPLPAPVASDFAGVIDAVAPDVTDLTIGDEVFGMTGGALTEQLIVNADAVTRRPADVSLTSAAVSPMVGLTAATILRNLHTANPNTEPRALVLGASGGIGHFLLPQLRQLGFVITATGGPDDEQRLRGAGADQVINYRNTDVTTHARDQQPDGYHLVVDMINQLDALLADTPLVTPGGQLVSTLFGPDADRFGDHLTVTYIRNQPDPAALAHLATLLADNTVTINAEHTVNSADALDAVARYSAGQIAGKLAILME